MPRPREFDRDDVLRKAMHAFWAGGYIGTSIKDLEKATGLKPGSIYGCFGDKYQLFIACLQLYRKEIVQERINQLKSEGTPKQRLEKFARNIIQFILEDDARIGCLMTNSAMEKAANDPGIRQVVTENMQDIEMTFRQILQEGVNCGDFPAHIDVTAHGRHLLAVLQGVRVIAKATPEKNIMFDIIQIALKAVTNDIADMADYKIELDTVA